MAWPEHTLRDWEELLRLSAQASVGYPGYIGNLWRGQADKDWPLRPSLHRSFTAGTTVEAGLGVERNIGDIFMSQFRIHPLPGVAEAPSDLLGRWALMQHYNAPTRLIDWSQSLFVAAYFAVESQWDRDGVIWCVYARHLLEAAFDNAPQGVAAYLKAKSFDKTHDQAMDDFLSGPAASPLVFSFASPAPTDRMVAQQGYFTVSAQMLGDQETLIDDLCAKVQADAGLSAAVIYRKFIIPKDEKPGILRHLRGMNVTAAALFPGVDGLGRSLSELARLAPHYPPDKW